MTLASLQKFPTGHFHISFRLAGRRFKRSLKTRNTKRAFSQKVKAEETIELIETGRIALPPDVDIASFVLNGGQVLSELEQHESKQPKRKTKTSKISLSELFRQFFDQIPDGNLEDTTLSGMHTHKRHLTRLIGGQTDIAKLTLSQLQSYVNNRAREKTQYGTPVGAVTINKELVTLGTVWRWAATSGFVTGRFPRKGIRLPKVDETPPFQTWSEIERKIKQEGLKKAAIDKLWDALYLQRDEIDEFLDFVRDAARHPFIFPMIVMAAHTGSRRSEIVRSMRSDFDFDSNVVTIRERKRVRGKKSTRRVPMTDTLRSTIMDWFESSHPGTPSAFAHCGGTRSDYGDYVSTNEARSHFENTLSGSKWDKIKGWHCLRHSFISNLASQGVDQRVIDDFVGHTTESMRRRYCHLFPNTKQAALSKVFG